MATTEAITARANRRARAIRTRRVTSSATAFASSTRSTARGSRPSCSCRLVNHPLAALEDADSVPHAALPRRDVRRSRQRSFGPAAGRRGLRRARVRGRRTGRPGRDGHGAGGARVGFRWVHSAHSFWPPSIQSACWARRSSLRQLPLGDPPQGRVYQPFQESIGHGRGLGEVQRALLAARLPRLPRVLLLAGLHRAALDQADRGLRRLGARDDGGDAHRHSPRAGGSARRRSRELCRRVQCPCWSSTGTEDAISRAGAGRSRWPTRPAGASSLLEGSGHGPHVRDPVKVNLLLRDFVGPLRAPARWVRGKSRRKRALYVSSPIGLGHARRDVAIARRAAKAAPRPRDRLAGAAPGHGRARGARRADPPRQRSTRQRVAPHRERVGRARPALLPGDRGAWTRSCSRTSWSSTISCATSSTTCGSATRRGSSTTTSTRTRSRSARRTSG